MIAALEAIDDREGDDTGDHGGVFELHDLGFDGFFLDVDGVEHLVHVEEAFIEDAFDAGEQGLGEIVVEVVDDLRDALFSVIEGLHGDLVLQQVHAVALIDDETVDLVQDDELVGF